MRIEEIREEFVEKVINEFVQEEFTKLLEDYTINLDKKITCQNKKHKVFNFCPACGERLRYENE